MFLGLGMEVGGVMSLSMLTLTMGACYVADIPWAAAILEQVLAQDFGDQIKGWPCEPKPLAIYLQLAIQIQQRQRPLDSCFRCFEAHRRKMR